MIGIIFFFKISERMFHDMRIRSATVDDVPVLIDLIRRSFKDVAERFGLTKENCATHPSFYTTDRMTSDFKKNIQCFILEEDGLPVGCVALEKAKRIRQGLGAAYFCRSKAFRR